MDTKYGVAWWALPKPDKNEVNSITGFVSRDLDRDGIRESGDPVVPGVLVDLFKADGIFVTSAYSQSDGTYSFARVAHGDYYVRFNAPYGDAFTLEDVGIDATDSDADTSGYSTVVFVGSQSVTNLDAGLCELAELGDFAWLDANGDGIQNPGEPGLPDVPVNLLDDQGHWLDSTTTDANGYYQFSNLETGSYQIQFVAPSGYRITSQNQGSDDTLDCDVNPHTAMTAVFALNVGDSDQTRDAGFILHSNGPPVAVPDSATTPYETAIDIPVLLNDSDPEGDALEIAIWSAPLHGSAVVDDAGTPADFTDDFVTSFPADGYSGPDSFEYQIDDGYGGTATAVVNVNVGGSGGGTPPSVTSCGTMPTAMACRIRGSRAWQGSS